MEKTNIYTIRFDNEMQAHQTQCLRGAINELLKQEDMMFHNHTENGLSYAYPLIQYKTIEGKAAIIGISDAADHLKQLAKKQTFDVKIGQQQTLLSIDKTEEIFYEPSISDEPKFYLIRRYIPLTDTTYERYRHTLALTDRICMIENAMIGNILSFFKRIGYRCEERIDCAIVNIEHTSWETYKRVKFKCFDLRFVSNVNLPEQIGLGKSTSVGFGTIQRLPQSDFEGFN